MENVSYYRNVTLVECDQSAEESPLVVNCAGCCVFDETFSTRNLNGRSDYYLQYVLKGSLRCVLTDSSGGGMRTVLLNAGDFILRSPFTPYRYYLPEGEHMEYLWVHFTGFYAGQLLSGLQLESGCVYSAAESMTKVEERFQFLFSEFANRGRGFDQATASRLMQILVCLSRMALIDGASQEKKLTTLAWLHSHFAENCSIRELAAMEHLSESRYRSVFRKRTGLSPSEYRTALRMQHACELLSRTDNNIEVISGLCGYMDVLYFIRHFKQKIGVPPGEYRRRIRNSEE